MKEARKTIKKQVSIELDIPAIKKQLLKRKVELEEQMRQLYQESLTIPDLVQDTGDKEQAVMQEILNISLENNEFQEYNNILLALKRIEDGEYGLCIDCGEPIMPKRLLLYPTATRCLSCQQASEENQA